MYYLGDEIEFSVSDDIKVYSSFDSMGLKEDLLRGIYGYGNFSCYLF